MYVARKPPFIPTETWQTAFSCSVVSADEIQLIWNYYFYYYYY